jgi:hypothetical protein
MRIATLVRFCVLEVRNMQRSTKTLCLVLALLPAICAGQEKKSIEVQEYFAEPRESIVPVVVFQPNSPLQFRQAGYSRVLGGGGFHSYRVENVSDKPIVELVIGTLALGGGIAKDTFKATKHGEWVMPGSSWPKELKPNVKSGFKRLELTDEIRKRYAVGPPLTGFILFMVVRVGFLDGTEYSDEKLYKELVSLCEEVEPLATMRK